MIEIIILMLTISYGYSLQRKNIEMMNSISIIFFVNILSEVYSHTFVIQEIGNITIIEFLLVTIFILGLITIGWIIGIIVTNFVEIKEIENKKIMKYKNNFI